MSHYFYNNVFDYVSADGNFGYFIEKDGLNTSANPVISSATTVDYVIEVHYLGDAANTLKLNISDIDTTKIEQVEYVSKAISDPLCRSAGRHLLS